MRSETKPSAVHSSTGGEKITLGDLRMMCNAITDGYPMSQEVREKVVKKLSEALDQNLNPRELVRVTTALISIDKTRLAAITASKPDQAPTVIIQQQGSGRDSLAEFVGSLTPEQQQDWLNRYGGVSKADNSPVAVESAT